MAAGSLSATVGQVILGLFFVIAGVNQFFNIEQMKAYTASKGVPAVGIVVPVAATLLAAGGIAILVDPLVAIDTLTAGAIVALCSTAAITVVMHDFWRMADGDDHLVSVDGADGGEAKALPPMDNEVFHFLKNVALMGGLLVLVA